MSLKPVVDTLDGVPESVREFYTERDGKFSLTVDGMVPRDRLDEFRNNNVALKRQMDELHARFDGVDPDRFRELDAKAAKERDRKLIDAGKVDELVAERVNAMKAEHDKQLAALTTEKQQITSHLESLVIDGAIRDHAAKAGVRPTAIEDVLLRGRSLFRMQDGKAIPMEGDKPIYGKSGDPMGMAEWLGSLTERAPHLFEPGGTGSAAPGGTPPRGAGVVSRTDQKSILANVEGIAAGKVRVA